MEKVGLPKLMFSVGFIVMGIVIFLYGNNSYPPETSMRSVPDYAFDKAFKESKRYFKASRERPAKVFKANLCMAAGVLVGLAAFVWLLTMARQIDKGDSAEETNDSLFSG